MPTVESVDNLVRRVAMRVVSIEEELSGAHPESQLARIWESIEELNLRVLFLMKTLTITKQLSPIADTKGVIPTQKMSALEAYMVGGGREKIIEQIAAEAKAEDDAREKESRGKNLPAEPGTGETQEGTAQVNGATFGDTAAEQAADKSAAASESGDGAPTLVNNDSKTKH